MDTQDVKVNEITDCFIYGRLNPRITNKVCQEIKNSKSTEELVEAGMGNDPKTFLRPKFRSTSIAWLKNTPYVSQVLAKLVIDANQFKFKLDNLEDTKPAIQYTVYKSYQDHYNWHQDYYDEEIVGDGLERLVSISLCLSHDDMYEGAEFCIKDGCDYNVRYFKMKYGDFIVFPSRTEHRVNALRNGERISLVAWYGKPFTG